MSNNKNALFARADELKKTIDSQRPLSETAAKKLRDYFKIGLTYASNALEGNSLTITETKVLLEDGITVGGKPIRDYYEATGHAKAYDFILEVSKTHPLMLTEDIIARLHYLFYNAIDENLAGKYRTEQVIITGTEYLPPPPEDVPGLMAKFVDDMNRLKEKTHPIEWAALIHKYFVDIHPYIDGNGRTARLLMNLALINAGYTVSIIPPVRRGDYIDALRISQREKSPDNDPFICLIADCLIETEKDYCRMFHIPLAKAKPEREPTR